VSTITQSPPRTTTPAWTGFIKRPEFITLCLIVVFCIAVTVVNPTFFSLKTLADTLRATITSGIFALGVLLVLAAGGIDVSFTAIGIFALYATTRLTLGLWPDAPYLLMVLIGVGMGVLMGMMNGFLVYRFNVPSLIVTIGMSYLFSGFLKAFIGSKHIMDIPPAMTTAGQATLVQVLSTGDIEVTKQAGSSIPGALIQFVTAGDAPRIALPVLFLVLVLAAALTWFILNRTLLGRAVYAVGGSIPIAERLGFSVRTVMLFVFGYAGLLAGLGGMIHGALNRQANPSDLVGTELNVIAAVVLGGARITGGTGTVLGTLLGVVLIELITNNLILMGVPSTWQKVVIGAIILVASFVFARRGTA
jgi:simple sugar transport system permease protein